MTIKLIWHGDLTSPSGYSRAVRGHVRALLDVGVDVIVDNRQRDVTTVTLDSYWTPKLQEFAVRQHEQARTQVWHETPDLWTPEHQNYNIGFVVWETSKIPDKDLGGNPRTNWVKQMNRMDEIWTASEWCKSVFQDSGVKKPIFVFPHPIDLNTFTDGDSTPMLEPTGNSFSSVNRLVFVSVFQWITRKNPIDLLTGFTSEFYDSHDVALLLKTYGKSFDDNTQLIDAVKSIRTSMRMPSLVKNVYPVTELVPETQLPGFYRAGSCYVCVPYGEGFGMPFQEAMASGIPCIYPMGGPMDEYIGEEYGYPVKVDAEPVRQMQHSPWYTGDQTWNRILMSDFRRVLKIVYQDWKSGKLKERGMLAREHIMSLHSYQTIGMSMYERLEAIDAKTRFVPPGLS